MADPKFFFEEDKESTESGVNWGEQSDFFNSVIQKEGKSTSQMGSMAPMGVQAEAALVRKQNSAIAVEYGRVKKDYVIHVIPCHPKIDFGNPQVFSQTSKITILLLNEVVPFDLQVNVFPPDPKWSVKAVSYKILGGAEAWNLDLAQLEGVLIPKILEQLGQFCVAITAPTVHRGPRR